MVRIGQQIEHVGGHPKVVSDVSEYVIVEGQPIEQIQTRPEDEKQVLELTTIDWPYKNDRGQRKI